MVKPRQASSRRNSTLVAAGILLSRLSGLARVAVLGRFLGVGPVTDAFVTALRIPNLLQNLLGEGVLSASFIPVYSRLLAQGREEEAGRVAGAVAGLLALVAGTLVLIGVVFAKPLTAVIAPGYTGEVYELTVTLVRILTPGVGFLVLSAWCLGVLNSHRRFFLSYVAPVLWNAAQIAALVGFGLAGVRGASLATALAWGAFAGSALQFAVQLPGVLRLTRNLRLGLGTRLPGVRATVRAFVPVVTGRGVVQLLSYVELALASLLAYGAVSALDYGQRLYLLPISLFGMSVAASELPEFAGTDHAQPVALTSRLRTGLARISFYVAPTAMAFVVLGDLIVAAIVGLRPLETDLVWLVLIGYSVGLLSNTSSRLLQSALYAVGDTKGPAVIAAVRVAIAAAVGGLLMLQLDRVALTAPGFPTGLELTSETLPTLAPLPGSVREALQAAGEQFSLQGLPPGEVRLGAVGLAAAAGASSWIEFTLLRRRLRDRLGLQVRVGGGQLARTAAAVGVAAVVAVAARFLVADLPPLLAAPAAGGLTGLAYVGAARAVGVQELRGLLDAMSRRRTRHAQEARGRGGRGGAPEDGA